MVSGPGGVGKGTIARLLVERDGRLWLSRSWTTRPQRPGEPDDAYVFVDHDTFRSHIEADGFLEWAEFHGNLYGTPWPDAPDDRDLLLEIDVQGARSVAERDPAALLIFVDSPTRSDQAERLRQRGDPEDAVRRRLAEGDRERSRAADLAAIEVINDDLARTVEEIASLIEARRGA